MQRTKPHAAEGPARRSCSTGYLCRRHAVVDAAATVRRESLIEVDQHQNVSHGQSDALEDAERIRVRGQGKGAEVNHFPGQQLERRSRKCTSRPRGSAVAADDTDSEYALAKRGAATRGIRQPEVDPDRNREIQD